VPARICQRACGARSVALRTCGHSLSAFCAVCASRPRFKISEPLSQRTVQPPEVAAHAINWVLSSKRAVYAHLPLRWGRMPVVRQDAGPSPASAEWLPLRVRGRNARCPSAQATTLGVYPIASICVPRGSEDWICACYHASIVRHVGLSAHGGSAMSSSRPSQPDRRRLRL